MNNVTVKSSLPTDSEAQGSPTGKWGVNQAFGELRLDPQLQLIDSRKVLKDKFGLGERVCASLDLKKKEMATFLNDLGKGKFDPGPVRKAMLWMRSKLGGPEYEVAVKQFRVKMAAAENRELFWQEDFLSDLTAAIKSCDSTELPVVIRVVHDLLAANPAARRDFFTNRLFHSFLTEARDAISHQGVEVDTVEKYGKFLILNQWCLDNGMECSPQELQSADQLQLTNEQFLLLVKKTMYCAIISPANERDQYMQYVQYMYRFPEEKYCSRWFKAFDETGSNFANLLRCFGRSQNEQLGKFKAFVDGLKNVADEISTSSEYLNPDERRQSFILQASEFLFDNTELMWAALEMRETNKDFTRDLFFEFFTLGVNDEDKIFTLGVDDKDKLFTSVALKEIGKVVGKNTFITEEQKQLLYQSVNFLALLGDPEGNKDAIDIFLKFVQDKGLTETFLADIFSANDATGQRLLEFIGAGDYSQSFKDAIRNRNFKAFVDSLKNIANEVHIERAALWEKGKEDNWEESFVQRASEFLLGEPKLMWAMLKMAKTNEDFLKGLSRSLADYADAKSTNGAEITLILFSSVALQAIKNEMKLNRATFTNEQTKLLLWAANFSKLLENQETTKKNKYNIHAILRFIQDRALNSNPPISFVDIMPETFSEEILQQLLALVKEGNYGQPFETFIKSGVAQRTARRTPSNQ
ncbi:MAG: hypothetical protein LBB17_00830 [Puniceicoccales bacterium]|jgi:hypothetical protein|nr:hypothetical protein [Puniceicoccales bacterium]